MNQYWKINLTLRYGFQKYLILQTVRAETRAEAIEAAVNIGMGGKYGGDKAHITERLLIGDEWIPAVFEFSFDDGWNCDTYDLDGYIITEADLHEAVRPLAECEFMRLIGAMPLPLEVSE